jgi:hypothetical protein
MNLNDAYHMGQKSAAAGFFFDGMEMVAATSSVVGGFEYMRGALELLFAEKDATNERVAWLTALVSRAFGQVVVPPTGVDEYRLLLTGGVFEIVNRWSYIEDIKTVSRMQAWFYCGFGIGRLETVYQGTALLRRLMEIAGTGPPVEQMPERLYRLAQEAAKQIDVAGEEDDFAGVRPLLGEVSSEAKSLALWLQRPLDAMGEPLGIAESLQHVRDVERKLALDVAAL